jgi:hypothetical protein
MVRRNARRMVEALDNLPEAPQRNGRWLIPAVDLVWNDEMSRRQRPD